METTFHKLEKTIIAFITIGFSLWSFGFIYTSSFIAIDGKRYFCLFDDAMISLRYAWNFSHGFGLVWNYGEHIQGYTNLLMTLWMSLATLIFNKSNAALSIQITGAIAMILIACMSMKISDLIIPAETRYRRMLVRIVTFFCALSYYPLTYWSLMGMETGILSLLLLLGVFFALQYTRGQNINYFLLTSVFLGLAFIARNDSIIFAFLIFFFIFWETSIHVPKMPIVVYFLFMAGQLVFQYLYYGELLPNTYTLKLTGIPLITRVEDGVIFTIPFLITVSLILVVACADLIFNFQKHKLVLLSIVFSSIGYQIYIGGDAWNYWRIMAPTMPLAILLFIGGLHSLLYSRIMMPASLARTTNILSSFQNNFSDISLILLALIGLCMANNSFWKEIIFKDKPYTSGLNQTMVNMAIAIDQVTTSDATVGVFTAGALPYYSGRKAIDFLGKNDRYIAHLPPDISGQHGQYGMSTWPGHNKYDLNYSIQTLLPTYVQLVSWGSQDLSSWAKARYVDVHYDGVDLILLKDSPAVLWDRISALNPS